MMLVPHQQTKRKGSGAIPRPLAESVRNSVGAGVWGIGRIDNQRDNIKPFLGPPSPKSLQSGLSTLRKELSNSDIIPYPSLPDAGE